MQRNLPFIIQNNLAKILQSILSIIIIFTGITILNFFLFGLPKYRHFIEQVKYEFSHSLYKSFYLNILLNNFDKSPKETCGGFVINPEDITLYKASYNSLKQDLDLIDTHMYREIEARINKNIDLFSSFSQVDASKYELYNEYYYPIANTIGELEIIHDERDSSVIKRNNTNNINSTFPFINEKFKELNSIYFQYISTYQQLQKDKNGQVDIFSNDVLLDTLNDIEFSLRGVGLEIDFYLKNLIIYATKKELIFPYIWFTFYWMICPAIVSTIIYIIRIAITMKNNRSENMSEKYVNNFHGSNIGNVANNINDYARQQANQNVYADENKKTLADAAAEIQKLLKQLEQYNSSPTEAEQIDYINDETTPGFKRRIVGALQGGTEAAIEEFLDNSYVNVGKAVIKGWIKPE